MGDLDEFEHLDRQDGEDAGHQIEQKPAAQGQKRDPGEVERCRFRQGCLAQVDRCRQKLRRNLGRAPLPASAGIDFIGDHTAPGVVDLFLGGKTRLADEQHARVFAQHVRLGSMAHQPGLEGVELQIPPLRCSVAEDTAFQTQHQTATAQAHLRGEGLVGLRHGVQRGADIPIAILVTHRRITDRQAQFQTAVFGDADVLADQPGGIDDEINAIAGKVRRYGDRQRQRHFGLVAIIHDVGAERQFFRRRPGDLAHFDTVGHRPVELDRKAVIAWIAPIGVPALRDHLMDTDAEFLTGGSLADIRHDARIDDRLAG